MNRHSHHLKRINCLVLLLISFSMTGITIAGDLTLEIGNLRGNSGNLLISVFNNSADYSAALEDSGQFHTFVALRPYSQSIKLTFSNFPAGTYAVIAVHDENSNNHFDSSVLGIPMEGLAISNTDGASSTPIFEEAAFVHPERKDSVQQLALHYFN